MELKLKPIIKWTGGKYREYEFFKDKIPAFNRYIEPFFGGGGVFFALQPKTISIINDKSTDLIRFYRLLSNSNFQQVLYQYANAWDEIKLLTDDLWHKFQTDFAAYIHQLANIIPNELLEKSITISLNQYKNLSNNDLIIDKNRFICFIADSILDKMKRIRRIVTKEQRQFVDTEINDHFQTAIKSGMYLYFRYLMNKNIEDHFFNEERAAANWYFVREFCYASMFRFNAKGEFNIPYGGIAYNKKNFRQKVDAVFSNEVQQLFGKTIINNDDFEKILSGIKLCKNDFIFVDPPYDSEFSEYDQNAFTAKDQQRLANLLLKCPAKWMLVIKETAFIRQLYTSEGIFIETFDKNYTYNVRGRNERAVKHLIITNY